MGSESEGDVACPSASASDASRGLPDVLRCDEAGCSYMATSAKTMKNHISKEHLKPRTCGVCGHVAPALRHLREHMRELHANEKGFRCDQCSYVGTSRDALHLHRAAAHGRKENQTVMRVAGGSVGPCQERFKILSQLRDHLACQHGISAARQKVTKRFTSLDEFKTWKLSYEQDTSAEYMARTSSLRTGGRAFFLCSRSGTYKPRGSGQRALKSQGSKKLGFRCTSAIRAVMAADGRVTATVFPFHYGHGTDLSDLPHLRIPQATRDDIKERLLSGDSFSTIMRNIRKKCELEDDDPSASRSYWLTRQDLHNMCNELNISTEDTPFDNERLEDLPAVELAEEAGRAVELQEAEDRRVASSRRQLWRKPSGQTRRIRQRHRMAARLAEAQTASVAALAGSVLPAWEVRCDMTAAADSSQLFIVEQAQRVCLAAAACELRCDDCGVCAHQFACDCPDWMAHQLPCEHVHLLCMLEAGLVDPPTEADTLKIDCYPGLSEGEDSDLRVPTPPPTSAATPPASLTGGQAALPKQIAGTLRKLVAVAPKLSPSVCRQIHSHLGQIQRLVARERLPLADSRRKETPPAVSEPRSASAGVGGHTLCVLRGGGDSTPVMSAAVERMAASTAQAAARDLCDEGARRQKRPRILDDHSY